MEGRRFHAKVEKTFVNGTLVYSDGKVDTLHRGGAMYITDVSFEKVDGVDRMRISKDYMTPQK